MKPLRLQASAFGPFAGKVDINFKALNAHSLFLIHGPTGGGKTTLLDAMCYALFGETSGGERKGRDMKSDHSQKRDKTEVIFEFALGQTHYKVERSFRIAGKTYKPKVALFRKRPDDDDYQTLSVKSREISERMLSLLGLTAAQFRQVVLLPQGRFRAFLTASSKEREEILESLFQTSHFREIEDALKAAAQQSKRTLNNAQSLRARALERAGHESLTSLKEERDGVLRAMAELEQSVGELSKRFDEKSAAHTSARALSHYFDERDAALKKDEELKAQQSEHEQEKAKLKEAERAKDLTPFVRAQKNAELAFKEVLARCENAQKDKSAQERLLSEHKKAFDIAHALAQEVPKHLERVRALNAAKESLLAYEKSEKERALLQEERKVLEKKRDETKDSAAKSAALLSSLEQKNSDIMRAFQALTAKERELSRLEKAVEIKRALFESEKKIALLQKQIERTLADENAAREKVDAQKQTIEAAEESWTRGAAAALAAHLHEGDACKVCGSKEHPNKAAHDEGLSKEVLQRERSSLEGLQKSLAEHALSRATLSAGLSQEEEIRAKLLHSQDNDSTLLDHEALLKETLAEVRSLRAQSSKSKQVSDERQKAQLELQKQEMLLRTLNDQVYACGSKLSAAQAVCEERKASLIEGFVTTSALAKEIAHLEVKAQTLLQNEVLAREKRDESAARSLACVTRLQSVLQEQERARQKCEDEREAFEKERLAKGFSSQEAFEKARLDDEALNALSERVEKALTARVQVAERLRAASKGIKDHARPDIDRLKEEYESARNALELAQNAQSAQKLRHSALCTFIDDVRASSNEIGDEQKRAEVTHTLAEIARGGGAGRVTFQRYVLGALLDEVLRSASERLHVMTRGRFLLQREKGSEQKRKSGGLDLVVTDAHTGSERSVHTLSGGESFLAALSLALGLADSVQSRAGGTAMDAVFIDEGFGGLDPDALDLAMDALGRLQDAGRVVGIISHVQELRERITARIEVERGLQGSRVKVVA